MQQDLSEIKLAWPKILMCVTNSMNVQVYYDFQLSKAREKFGHKVLTFKLSCCHWQLAPFPRKSAWIDHVWQYPEHLSLNDVVSLGNGTSCPWQHSHQTSLVPYTTENRNMPLEFAEFWSDPGEWLWFFLSTTMLFPPVRGGLAPLVPRVLGSGCILMGSPEQNIACTYHQEKHVCI